MKIKIVSKDFIMHNVPLERLVFDANSVKDTCLLVDDVNEKRWQISFKCLYALKLTDMDYAGLDFRKGKDFPDDCFEGSTEQNRIFRKFIFEVEDSKWIKELKTKEPESALPKHKYASDVGKARHFLLLCYDYIVEIIAWDLELVQV